MRLYLNNRVYRCANCEALVFAKDGKGRVVCDWCSREVLLSMDGFRVEMDELDKREKKSVSKAV